MPPKLNQCISVKIQNQIDQCDETKKEYSLLIPHCKPELKEATSWTTVGQAKPQPTCESFMSRPSLSLRPDPPSCN